MKKASTREAQHGFAKLLAAVEKGETVLITRRGRVVAKLARASEDKPQWPDFEGRMQAIFTKRVKGKAISAIIIDDREDRF